MMKWILPVIGLFIGAGAGVGAGVLLSPDTVETAAETEDDATQTEVEDPAEPFDLVTLQNQFVVPVVQENQVKSMVVLTLALEVTQGTADAIHAREAKLRDLFLRSLFQHANIGGFTGDFTALRNLELLRSSLLSAAQEEIGTDVQSVLITNLARQDV